MLSSVDIKRELLQQSDMTGIRKRAVLNEDPNFEQNIIEQADALEKMVATSGWVYLEAYMMTIVREYLVEHKHSELVDGIIRSMQYVDQIIKARNQIFERREKKDGMAQG